MTERHAQIAKLDRSQQEAVESAADTTVVIAGAGSGKTRVLAARVVYLVTHCGVAESTVVVLTFTRFAAQEIKSRIQSYGVDTSNMLIGTYHSVFRSLTSDTRIVLTRTQAERLLKQCASDLGYFNQSKRTWKAKLSFKKVCARLDALYVGCGRESGEPADRDSDRIVREYLSRLESEHATDFDGILSRCWQILAKHEPSREVQHLLVDEVQDTDSVQYMILRRLSESASLFVVGDPRQAIFAFRGADSSLMSQLSPSAEYFILRATYRCDHQVTLAANNLELPYAVMMSMTDKQGCVRHVQSSLGSLARLIAETAYNSKTVRPNKVAVLARWGASLDELQTRLTEQGVAFNRLGASVSNLSESFLASLMRVITHKDSWSLTEDMLLHLDSSGDLLRNAWSTARRDNVSLLDGVNAWYDEEHNAENEPTVFRLVKETSSHDTTLRLIETLDELLTRVDQKARELSFHDVMCRAVQLTRIAMRPFTTGRLSTMTIEHATRWLALSDVQDLYDPDDCAVTCATIHAAKGLEWDNVFVIDLNEGVMPRFGADEQEERLAMYVAITRAKSSVVLHSRYSDSRIGHLNSCGSTSLFVYECGIDAETGAMI